MVTHWTDKRTGRHWQIPQDQAGKDFPACREVITVDPKGDRAVLGGTCIWDRRELRPMTVGEWELLAFPLAKRS